MQSGEVFPRHLFVGATATSDLSTARSGAEWIGVVGFDEEEESRHYGCTLGEAYGDLRWARVNGGSPIGRAMLAAAW